MCEQTRNNVSAQKWKLYYMLAVGKGRRSYGHFGHSMSGMNLNDWQEFFAVLLFVGTVTVIFTWFGKLVLSRTLAAAKRQPAQSFSKQDKVVLGLGAL
jgi:hypothetical protein